MSENVAPETDNPKFFANLIAKGIMNEKSAQTLRNKFQTSALSALLYLANQTPAKKTALCRLWADSLGVAYFELEKTLFQPEIVKKVPENIAKKYKILPVYIFGNTITIATFDPANAKLAAELEKVVGNPVSLVFSLPDQIDEAIQRAYDSEYELKNFIDKISSSKLFAGDEVLTAEKLRETAGNQAIMELPVCIVLFAVKENASDVHIEPGPETATVRFRLDGVLKPRMRLDGVLLPPLLERMKTMAKLDAKESGKPLKGRIDFPLPDQRVELFFSTMPMFYGEKAILALASKTRLQKVSGLREIYLSKKNHDRATSALNHPCGLILFAGPRGTRKSDLLYSCLDHINDSRINIVTIEETVRHRLDGVNQIRVNEPGGIDAADAIEWSLSQDVQVLALDETRTEKEAKLMLESALTGHLALAGIRANDSFRALVRFFQLGAKPHETLPAVLGVFSQRSARKLCMHCRKQYEASPEETAAYFKPGGTAEVRLYRATGCDKCGGTGFSGVLQLHETLVLDDGLRKLVSPDGGIAGLEEAAKAGGFQNARYDGFKKALRGLTTIEEVERVAGP